MVLDSTVAMAGMSFPVSDADTFGEVVDRLIVQTGHAPRLLAFGEAMHGEEEFLRRRNELFRHLVEHAGYRSIAIESCCLRGRLVDTFVRNGLGDIEHVLRQGFSHGFGDSPANRTLVRWMAEYNRSRDVEDGLRFVGFDAPMEMSGAESPRAALALAYTYLRSHLEEDLPYTWSGISDLLGDDDRWTEPAAAMDPARSVGASADVRELRLIADDLRLLLAGEAPGLLAGSSPDELWDAELGARTAAGLLAYHAGMASPSPHRVARLLSVRDTMMADNLCALAHREAQRGPTLVFAHNQHVHKGASHWQLGDLSLRWYCAGALLATRLGDGYAVIGSAIGAAPHQGINAPAPDTVEGWLATLPVDAQLVRAEDLAGAIDKAEPRPRRRPQVSDNYTYFPIDPGAPRDLDAVFFLRDIPEGGPDTQGSPAH